MSHIATKWAFDQPELHRDMKPSEWAVLIVLADCHNPVNGCFPSQEYICSRTNLGERAVRDQLARLKGRNLINWSETWDKGHRAENRYALAFEADFIPANSAGSQNGEIEQVIPAKSDTSNRQNSPPSMEEPVTEPVTLPPTPLTGGRAATPSADQGWAAFKAAFTADGEPIGRPSIARPIFDALSEADRAEATKAAGGYVRMRKAAKRPPQKVAAQTFLRERDAWLGYAKHAPQGERTGSALHAGAFDRVWWWLVFGWIIRHAGTVADRDSVAGRTLRDRISIALAHGIGWQIEPDALSHAEADALVMVKARVDGPEFAVWRTWAFREFRIDLPRPDKTQWVWLPALSPEDWPAMMESEEA